MDASATSLNSARGAASSSVLVALSSQADKDKEVELPNKADSSPNWEQNAVTNNREPIETVCTDRANLLSIIYDTIRPQGNREKLEGSRICTSVVPNEPQVTIGGDRSFTYDHVFDQQSQQPAIYDACIEKLVEGLFDGYNATVLAYGQTGSGKTFTMGTAFDTGLVREEEVGVIPRAISHLFRKIADLRRDALEKGILEPTFDVSVQFIELYNEDVIDLLTDDRAASLSVRIHEDARGEIYLHGITGKNVTDLHSTLEILKNGALNRTVASTNMNEQSSRSHAIFTMVLKMQRVVAVTEASDSAPGATEMEVLSAKFHFVDLAGSERLKRTGATGDRAKEGISINCGLLALGNVISALGGANGKVSHVPYRDSKLTRLLQDSLGGNSRTLMIACVSPSDSDFVETLNTLKYANRAKNIKNKVEANLDKSSKLMGEMRGRIAALEAELLEFKQGRRTVDGDGFETVNDQYHENVMLTAEVNQLRFRVKALQETNEILRNRNVEMMAAKDFASLGGVPTKGDGENGNGGEQLDPMQAMVRKYLEELERVRSQLFETQAASDQHRKESMRWKAQALAGGGGMVSTPGGGFHSDNSFSSPNFSSQLIEEAKSDLDRMKRSVIGSEVTSDYASHGETGDDLEDRTSNEADDLDSDDDDGEEEGAFEETREAGVLRDNLNDLQTEISIKERLITELERSERRLAEVRLTYEKKLTELSLRIKQTEAERDKVLLEGAEKKNDKASQEQAKRIREEYEHKLTDMRNEFRKLQMVEKEHKRMQARQERERQELVRYQGELKELKKGKVDLMKRIKDEMKKAQEQQAKNAKRIAALDKEQRAKDMKLKQMENKDRQREQFMKRTNEEIIRLKKENKEKAKQVKAPMSTPVRGAVRPVLRTPGIKGQPPAELIFSPKHAKLKWTQLEKKLARLITRKQTVGKMEEEMGRLLSERQRLTNEIQVLQNKFVNTGDVAVRDDLNEQLDGARQKLTYIQGEITEVQATIVEIDANKEGGDEMDESELSNADALFEQCSNIVEARYLLQHLFAQCMEQGVLAANSKAENRELDARIQQLEQQSFINEQLLSTVIEDKSIALDLESVLDNSLRRKSRSSSVQSLRNGSTSPSLADGEPQLHSYKARRRTATADELLYASPTSADQSLDGPEPIRTEEAVEEEKKEKSDKRRILVPLPASASATHPPAFSRNTRLRSTIGSLPSLASQKKPPAAPSRGGSQPHRGLSRMMSTGRLPVVSEGGEDMTIPPPTTPRERTPVDQRKSVFARLAEASPSQQMSRKQGRIVAASGSSSSGSSRVVTRSHTLEGHSKGILAVASTEELLMTGSKDRTAKLWDLNTGHELRTFGLHPNNVHAVRFIPGSQLALSVSMYQVRVWDLRTHECLRVLQSSGQVIDGDGGAVGSRQNTVPFLETVVNAVEVDPTGRLLFTSFAGDVRIWNLERWASFGRLVGASHSPRSEVSCLAVATGEENTPFVFTGSRDHYVKMYEVNPAGEGVHEATVEFSPPHYDNVTCTLMHGDHLYTASKDMNIMKFSLKDNKRDHLELKAHNTYVQGMCLSASSTGHPLLTSVCKEGTMKFWDVTSTRRMKLVEEIQKAHSEAINEVCSNSYMVFTASSDQTVGFWKLNGI